jgi:diguanylate cyclase (GGDEF)-like protein/PAS domain S-box-containing protein
MATERLYESLHYLVDEVVFISNAEQRIFFASPSVKNVLGYECEAFLDIDPVTLIHPDDLAAAGATATELRAAAGNSYRTTVRILHAQGHYIWCDVSGRNLLDWDVKGIVNTLRDVSDRRALEEKLVHLSIHDELTGLYNRRGFMQLLRDNFGRGQKTESGLMMVDLDGFKQVNDRFGHAVGDEVLARCAKMIQQALRPGDIAGRIGGDEFAILCHRIGDTKSMLAVAERVRRGAGGVYEVAGEAVMIGLSIGAVLCLDNSDPDVLLRIADEALYQAKTGGRDQVILAQP